LAKKTGATSLDQLDLRIIRGLLDDARQSVTELGAKVGLSATACARRMQRLRDDGIIRGYRVVLNRHRFGMGALVMVRITLERQSEECLKAFEQSVLRCPSVLSCYLMSGSSDYLMSVLARDIDDFERVHKLHLSKLPHVMRIEASFTLREVIRREITPEAFQR
jgi:DNA-binding Lrp family transcriptional regulator